MTDPRSRADKSNFDRSETDLPSRYWKTRAGLVIALAGLTIVIIGGASRLLWPSHAGSPAQTTSSTPVPGTGTPTGAIDNSAPIRQPAQPAPTDRSENTQRGLNSTQEQPTRDGVQK
jgi:hypothetical protein